ncbi:unnamed protein product [Protopolystoma xenopodis]|uniref:Anaphase-promoting complex subunit 4 WD40 domain-containing protein n=1 Tax=Protopolystoma xenopodis TaxID=117903 RepID=A0A3S4ZIZ0_9PLAT|nr:unnamed protein product [Protopolystoma xenopodis]
MLTGGAATGSSWIRRAHLVDPRTSVTGLQFAPRHLGLQLAGVSTDGILRIYEAQDVMNLSQWTLQFDFGTKMTGSCLAWSQVSTKMAKLSSKVFEFHLSVIPLIHFLREA